MRRAAAREPHKHYLASKTKPNGDAQIGLTAHSIVAPVRSASHRFLRAPIKTGLSGLSSLLSVAQCPDPRAVLLCALRACIYKAIDERIDIE